VVAAAALIMIAVFTSFIPGGTPTLKPIAFALAFGVLLDAFLVRMTLVPAVLALAGRAAWWLPGWLSRILPDLDVEGAKLAPPAQETTRSDALTV
jgi:RND superfamily putative drug exporter